MCELLVVTCQILYAKSFTSMGPFTQYFVSQFTRHFASRFEDDAPKLPLGKALVSMLATGFTAVLTLVGCMPTKVNTVVTKSRGSQSAQLTISAAASLQNALTEITPLFQQVHPDIEVFYNWGGSGTLQRQIEQGAPADIFFPASTQQMAALVRKRLVYDAPAKEAPQSVLTNELVLIAPLDSALTGFEDLAGSAKQLHAKPLHAKPPTQLAVGEFRSVPAGQYAQATLRALHLLPELSSELVFFSNVRGVLAAVENGHAEAGLVYRTDAELSDRVKIVAIAPAQTYPPIRYPIAIIKGSKQTEAAQEFIDFLTTPAAEDVFQQFGFMTAEEAIAEEPILETPVLEAPVLETPVLHKVPAN